MQEGAFVLALFVALYVITLALGRLLFRHPPGTASLQALSVGFPTATFLGSAILAGLYGSSSAVTVAIAAIVSSLLLIAPTQVLLEIDCAAPEDISRGSQAGSPLNTAAIVRSAIARTLRAP